MLQLLELIEEFGKHKIMTQRFSSLLIKRRAHAPSKPSSIYIRQPCQVIPAETRDNLSNNYPNCSKPTISPMIPTIVMASVVTVVPSNISFQKVQTRLLGAMCVTAIIGTVVSMVQHSKRENNYQIGMLNRGSAEGSKL